jgi:hypothetical protein
MLHCETPVLALVTLNHCQLDVCRRAAVTNVAKKRVSLTRQQGIKFNFINRNPFTSHKTLIDGGALSKRC